jgi:hypothetical protein
MLLNNRQQLAQSLARELQKFAGVWIISPLPLNDNNQLRIQILEASGDRNKIFQAINDWGFGTPVFVNMTPRIIGSGMAMASIYEIAIERERQPVADRTIRGEIAERKKPPDREHTELLKYLGLGGKK